MEVPTAIELMRNERLLLAKIKSFKLSDWSNARQSREELDTSCIAAKKLTQSLLKRKAIPQIRRDFFTNPELNIGVSKSRMEVFESNGTNGEEILEHPHFLPHLRYFIFGPELPDATISKFFELVENDAEYGELLTFARSEVRQRKLDRLAAREEFFKLALECELDVGIARSIRDTVGRMKTTR